MQNEIRNIFPEIKIVGCLFLFKQSLLRHLRNLGLYNKEYKIKSNEVIKSYGSLPFTIHNNPKDMNILLEKLKKELGYIEFSVYFEEEWAQFIGDDQKFIDYVLDALKTPATGVDVVSILDSLKSLVLMGFVCFLSVTVHNYNLIFC